MMTQDEKYMKAAMKQAKKAAAIEEVPIGCVIVYEDKIIGRGYNKRNLKKNTLAHAEIIAMNKASKVIGDWRLEDCTMYVTLEPCPMCAGGIINSRIETVRYGARDEKAGCCSSVLNLFEERFNHHPRIYRGPLEPQCQKILQDFFLDLREDGEN